MDDVSRVHLLLFRAIRALASPLMTIGMTAKELIEISKLAFVDAAIKKYSKGTHAASNTRVVQKTGLSKHEVRRLRAKLQETTTEPDLRPVPEGAVLHRWYTDPEFLDQSGRPKPLGKGSGRGTLVELIEKSEIGDVSQELMIARMFQYGHVVENDDKLLVPVSRGARSPQNIDGFCTLLRGTLLPICSVIENNFLATSETDRWLQITAYAWPVPGDKLGLIRSSIRDRGAQFAKDADDFMSTMQLSREREDLGENALVGAGVYFFEESRDAGDHIDAREDSRSEKTTEHEKKKS